MNDVFGELPALPGDVTCPPIRGDISVLEFLDPFNECGDDEYIFGCFWIF